ncbi:unnamed protein product [Cuscuta epithymum]|uniref:Peptidase A1 domain-containing protein n=1 Tax=Cuscuta epithymum TaxID=186058 RepID=A0AAV0CC25_9ASTE|nr:unnamed protein product [Cuscuta epithymum]
MSILISFILCIRIAAIHVSSSTPGAIYEYEVHNRYSTKVVSIFGKHGLPQKGSQDYISALLRRDSGRAHSTPGVTFPSGDAVVQLTELSSLHFAEVFIGTPPTPFMVSLDTGSSLLWIPCNCKQCIRNLTLNSGEIINLNIYYPDVSSTQKNISCDNPKCISRGNSCPSPNIGCPYEIHYMDGSSTSGVLISDMMRLSTYEMQPTNIQVEVTFGCASQVTGYLLGIASVNGLLGLGPGNEPDNTDVLTTLASTGVVGNSFSLCFSPNGKGRLVFGDIGTPYRREAHLDFTQKNQGYNVWITQIAVDEIVLNVDFPAIFDSGTSFTSLTDPAYSFITQSFDSQVKEQRRQQSDWSFEFCYDLSENQSSYRVPLLSFRMTGGSTFDVLFPTLNWTLDFEVDGTFYCLAISKSKDVNIIGQNFFIGYNMIFDREKHALGWEPSICEKNQFNITTYPSKGRRCPHQTSVAIITIVVVLGFLTRHL